MRITWALPQTNDRSFPAVTTTKRKEIVTKDDNHSLMSKSDRIKSPKEEKRQDRNTLCTSNFCKRAICKD